MRAELPPGFLGLRHVCSSFSFILIHFDIKLLALLISLVSTGNLRMLVLSIV